MLTWKRDKIEEPFLASTRTHTTHTTTLSSGQTVMVKSVEGSFFFYVDGKATGGFVNSLREAKEKIQAVEDKIS